MVAIKKGLVAVTAISLSMLTMSASAEVGNGEYAIGYQNGFATGGIVARIGINDEISAEAVLGLFGTLTHYGVRGLYRLKDEDQWDAYVFGSTGIWSWDSGSRFVDDETAFGVGAGAGIEWDWRTYNSDLPPITWNLEIGLGLVNFDNYNYSAFSIGGGGRYHF